MQVCPLMDVQSLELRFSAPDRARFRGPKRAPGDDRARSSQPQPAGSAPAARSATWQRALLLVYTGAWIAVGIGALAWSTLRLPILPQIDPGLPATGLAGPSGGLLLWIAFGFIGSLRVLPIPGSSAVWTFHFPFVAAAMVLGGPTAGAWVAFLATLERRELESQPWYGTLANHAVTALGAVVGGLTVLIIDDALRSASVEAPVAKLAAVAAGTLVLAATVHVIVAGTIMLRERLAPITIVDLMIRTFGPMTLGEIGLAWMFVIAYLAVGWWAPLALAVGVLIVWPREGLEFVDPLTRLPRMAQFHRELDSALARSRLGLSAGGLLLMIDLDGFGEVNKQMGKHIGDEVLIEIGNRIRANLRVTDLAGRLGGDEFAEFYSGVVELPVAWVVARRLERAIRQPVMTSEGEVRVGVSIGALIVKPGVEAPPRAALMAWADRTMQEQKRAQKAGRARSGIRFHRYGTTRAATSPAPASDPAGAGGLPGRRGADGRDEPGRMDRLMPVAMAVSSVAFALALLAWLVRVLV
jgi:diguanylate cyclase (GGDEF)-like protein